jgi:hypothetical protein
MVWENDITWPFPTKEQPLTPWTPKQVREQQKKWAEEQLKNIPDSPLIGL